MATICISINYIVMRFPWPRPIVFTMSTLMHILLDMTKGQYFKELLNKKIGERDEETSRKSWNMQVAMY